MKRTGKAGRPSLLTPGVQEAVCRALVSGCYRETAARHAGIGSSTFRGWMERAEADMEKDVASPHREFREAVLKAEADAELALVTQIRQAAAGDKKQNIAPTWQAAAWLLERKHPDKYGRRVRQDVEVTGAVQADVEVVHSKVVEVTPDADRRAEIAKILAEAEGIVHAN